MIFEPLDFTARLAALVPKPRVNLTRFPSIVRRQRRPNRVRATNRKRPMTGKIKRGSNVAQP